LYLLDQKPDVQTNACRHEPYHTEIASSEFCNFKSVLIKEILL